MLLKNKKRKTCVSVWLSYALPGPECVKRNADNSKLTIPYNAKQYLLADFPSSSSSYSGSCARAHVYVCEYIAQAFTCPHRTNANGWRINKLSDVCAINTCRNGKLLLPVLNWVRCCHRLAIKTMQNSSTCATMNHRRRNGYGHVHGIFRLKWNQFKIQPDWDYCPSQFCFGHGNPLLAHSPRWIVSNLEDRKIKWDKLRGDRRRG